MRTMLEDFKKGILKDNDVYIALDDKKIVGWACLFDAWYNEDFVQVFVSPRYRRKNIAKTLVKAMGNKKVKCFPHDKAGIKFFEQFPNIKVVDFQYFLQEKKNG